MKKDILRIFFIYLGLVLMIPLLSLSVNAVEILFTNPSPVRAGRVADITLQIQAPHEMENPKTDVTFYIEETDDIKPVAGQEFFVPRINPGQILTRTFSVYFSDSVPTGNYPLRLVEKSGDSLSKLRFDIFVEGRLNVPELRIGSVRSIPSSLIQDTSDNIINVDLQNLGELDAELVTARLVTEDSIKETFFGSLEDSLPSIPGSDSKTLKFEFDIEETDKTSFDSYLDVSYRMNIDNNYEVVDVQIPFEIRLGRTPRFEILEIIPLNKLRVGGKNNEIEVRVKNTGATDGENIRLRLYPDPSSPFDFERTTIFVSALMLPNETKSFIVPFDILDEALLQGYNIDVEFESVLGSNRYKQRDRLDIDVTDEASTGIASFAAIIISISVLISFGIGFVYNRKKKRK